MKAALFYGPSQNSVVFPSVVNGVNSLSLTGSVANQPCSIAAIGPDTNISINYVNKAFGNHSFFNNGLLQFRIVTTSGAVNYMTVTGSATNNAVKLAALGTDTNVGIALAPKGTGVVTIPNPVIVATPPATATSAGVAGQVAYDAAFFYVCAAANTWVRAPLAAW